MHDGADVGDGAAQPVTQVTGPLGEFAMPLGRYAAGQRVELVRGAGQGRADAVVQVGA